MASDDSDFYLYNRSWMYNRTGEDGAINIHFLRGVEAFVSWAITKGSPNEIRCPCVKCKNRKYIHPDEVRRHVSRKGFVPGYHDWSWHLGVNTGEGGSVMPFVVGETSHPSSSAEQPQEDLTLRMVHDANASMFPEYQDYTAGGEMDSSPQLRGPEEPNPRARQFYQMLEAANRPLYSGCESFTEMSMVGRMTNMKASYHCPERLYDDFCTTMKEALPQPNLMPTGFYETKKLIAGLGLPAERIDCCVRGCMIFWGSTKDDTHCRKCNESRWRTRANGKKTPRKQFHYLPLSPRLQRLYASRVTAGEMRWHDEHYREHGEMCHPSDSEAWRHFNNTHPDFAVEARNVRLGLCTDGFDPFGLSGKQYSTWPVILTPYNLPPWMCMKRPYMFLTVIAPGPDNPKQNIDIYLEPLIDELKMLWSEGVVTYDASTRTNFTMRAALMWTISDFPAYSMLSGWSTHGLFACPWQVATQPVSPCVSPQN